MRARGGPLSQEMSICEAMGENDRTGALDVDKVHIVCRGVDHGPERHGVGDLAMEPDVLVRGEKPSEARTDDTDDIAKHGEEDEASVVGKDQACTTGAPHGELEAIEGGELRVRGL